jgi:hypothetical protein
VPQFDSGFLVHSADPNGVLFLAISTTPQETAISLTSLCIGHLVDFDAAALHASGRVAPTLLLKELDSSRFIAAGEWDFFDDIRVRQVVAFLH